MKRLSFKPEFHADILSGKKTGTIRLSNLNLEYGDIVSAIGPNRYTKAVADSAILR